MTQSWTSCNCCGSREDVAPVEADNPAWHEWLCLLCRRGLCADCSS